MRAPALPIYPKKDEPMNQAHAPRGPHAAHRLRRALGALGAIAAVAAGGCAGGKCRRTVPVAAEVEPAPAPVRAERHGKPEAPARVEVVFEEAVAHVTVRFDGAGEGVDTRAYGVKGLTVKGNGQLTQDATVSAGEAKRFDVAFTPGPGESLLVVAVRGRFAVGERTAVRTFPVGSQPQQAPKTTTVGGEKVRVVPAVEEQR